MSTTQSQLKPVISIPFQLTKNFFANSIAICQLKCYPTSIGMEFIDRIVLQISHHQHLLIQKVEIFTWSIYSFSQARWSNVRTPRMAKTSGGSHMREGKDVIKRLRYLKAISLALAMQWVLKTTWACSSDVRCFGEACWDALMLRSLMESRITFIIHRVLIIEKHSKSY